MCGNLQRVQLRVIGITIHLRTAIVMVTTMTEALLVDLMALDRKLFSNEEGLLDGGRSGGPIGLISLIDHVEVGLHVAHLLFFLTAHANDLWVDLHLNLSLSLAFGLLTTVDLVMHFEQRNQRHHITDHKIQALYQLEKARIVTCKLYKLQHVDSQDQIKSSPHQV